MLLFSFSFFILLVSVFHLCPLQGLFLFSVQLFSYSDALSLLSSSLDSFFNSLFPSRTLPPPPPRAYLSVFILSDFLSILLPDRTLSSWPSLSLFSLTNIFCAFFIFFSSVCPSIPICSSQNQYICSSCQRAIQGLPCSRVGFLQFVLQPIFLFLLPVGETHSISDVFTSLQFFLLSATFIAYIRDALLLKLRCCFSSLSLSSLISSSLPLSASTVSLR